ncbi:MAG: MBL fold metallo-hydrolase [Candidatus Heimdallarchaeaceae archaeon]
MRIYDNIYIIRGFAHSYLIDREQYCVLIDTGAAKSASKVIHSIKTYCPNKPLKTIFVIHSHMDHTNGLESLGLLYGPEIISHEKERGYIMQLEKLPTADNFKGKLLNVFSTLFSPKAYSVDRLVKGGEVIHGLKIHHLPGHTPGTIALEDLESGLVFTSDVIGKISKKGKIYPPHPFYASDYQLALKSSIKFLKTTKPKALLPSHGHMCFNPERPIEDYLEKFGKV